MNKKYRYQKFFSEKALDILYAYNWPGNVRELKNVVEQAVILSTEDEICPSDLPMICCHPEDAENQVQMGPINLKQQVAAYEYGYMSRAYERYGNVRAAAASLGMDAATFVRKRQKYLAAMQK